MSSELVITKKQGAIVLDCEEIISRFVEPQSKLWIILVTHSQCVADLAVQIAQGHPELGADVAFVREAAMLHDVGVVKTNAPSIFCQGEADYICHGILGRQMLDKLGLHRHALVCERHTGSGLSAQYIKDNNLPLPVRDMLPVSIEEKIVCYADKFFSKSKNLTERKKLHRVVASLEKYGAESVERFMQLDALLHIPALDPQ